jgi:hypothetical protein
MIKPHEVFTNSFVILLESMGFVFDRKIKRNLKDEQLCLSYDSKINPINIIDESLVKMGIKSDRSAIDTYSGQWLIWGKKPSGLWLIIIDTQKRTLTLFFSVVPLHY